MPPAPESSRAPFRYVFVSDQGRVFGCHDKPTPEDFAFAATGIYTILRLADLHRYDTERSWRPIPFGTLGHAGAEAGADDPFHAA